MKLIIITLIAAIIVISFTIGNGAFQQQKRITANYYETLNSIR